jgi:hypothetical protein
MQQSAAAVSLCYLRCFGRSGTWKYLHWPPDVSVVVSAQNAYCRSFKALTVPSLEQSVDASTFHFRKVLVSGVMYSWHDQVVMNDLEPGGGGTLTVISLMSVPSLWTLRKTLKTFLVTGV